MIKGGASKEASPLLFYRSKERGSSFPIPDLRETGVILIIGD